MKCENTLFTGWASLFSVAWGLRVKFEIGHGSINKISERFRLYWFITKISILKLETDWIEAEKPTKSNQKINDSTTSEFRGIRLPRELNTRDFTILVCYLKKKKKKMYSDCFQVDMAPDIESCHSGRKQTSPVDKEMCKQVVFIHFCTCTIPALEKIGYQFFFPSFSPFEFYPCRPYASVVIHRRKEPIT